MLKPHDRSAPADMAGNRSRRVEQTRECRRKRRKRVAAAAMVAAALGATAAPGYFLAEHAQAKQGAPVAAAETAKVQVVAVDAATIPLSAGTELTRLPWGEGAASVGLRAPEEGLVAGPQALAVAPDGRIAILDTLNHRLVRLSALGAYEGDIPVDLLEPRFLAVSDDRLVVLDCDSSHGLVEVDWTGNVLSEMEMPETTEPVSGIFIGEEGILVETGHSSMFLLEKATGGPGAATDQAGANQTDVNHGDKTASRGQMTRTRARLQALPAERAGRPAGTAGRARATATFERGKDPRLTTRNVESGQATQIDLKTTLPVDHLMSLDADDRGGTIVGCRVLGEHSEVQAQRFNDQAGVSLAAGTLLITRVAEAASGPYSSLMLTEHSFADIGAPYVVAPNGLVYQPVANAEGYRILVHHFAQEVQQ